MENNTNLHEEHHDPTYNLDVDALNALISFARANNPRFKDLSEAKIAELCDVSVTTFKDIRKGRCHKPRVDILYSIVSALGGSIDRLVGLAPSRDIEKEKAAWDATLVEGYQQRIDALTAQLAEKDAEITKLRDEKATLLLEIAEKHEEHAVTVKSCEQYVRTIDAQDRTIKFQRRIIFGIITVWLLFELLNPAAGITGAIVNLFAK